MDLNYDKAIEVLNGSDVICEKYREEIKKILMALCGKESVSKIIQQEEFIKTLHFSNNYCDVAVINSVRYARIPLPNANTKWTIWAFDAVKEICEKIPGAYPFHQETGFNNSTYLYVYLPKVK